MSTPMHKRELQAAIKLQKAQCLLLKMNDPVSRAELEKKDKVNRHMYQQLFNLLAEKGLIIRAGDRGRERLWQATTQVIKHDAPSLADASYVHNPDNHAQKYKNTYALARQRKSARVYVSGGQPYASF